MGVTIGYKGETIASMSSSGSKTLKTAGKYCEGDIEVAYTESSTNSKCFKMTVAEAYADSQWHYFNNADADIAAHINDPTFVVTVMNVTDYDTDNSRTIGVTATNHQTNSASTNASYGMVLRTNSSGSTVYSACNKDVTVASPASGGSQICVTSDGRIGVYGSTSYKWEAGSYVALCGW